jgi:hypothetical protein
LVAGIVGLLLAGSHALSKRRHPARRARALAALSVAALALGVILAVLATD